MLKPTAIVFQHLFTGTRAVFEPREQVLCFVLALLLCCSEPKAAIVPRLELNKTSAELGTPVEFTYSFATKSQFTSQFTDTTVFVHFLDEHHVRRFQDDHVPPKPVVQWRPGEKYTWTRTVFIPKNIPIGRYSVLVGLYSPSKTERIPLEGKLHNRLSYKLATLDIETSSERPSVQYLSGWYDPETDPSDARTSWRWTKKEAILTTRNPKEDAFFYLKLEGVPQRFSRPQDVTLTFGNQELDSFLIRTNQPFLKKYKIPKNALGDQPEIAVKLTVNQTFVPAADGVSRDKRELGVLVHYVYFGKAFDMNQ